MEGNLLYKYRNFGEYTNNIIKNSSLYLSPIKQFNDPFDSSLSYHQYYTRSAMLKYWKDSVKIHKEEALSLGYRKDYIHQAMKPYSKNEAFVEQHNRIRQNARDKMGVLSLSRTSTSILMWSHYANNHKGLVFGFEPKAKDSKSCLAKPMKVDYEITYDLLSYVANSEIRQKQYIKELLTKFKDWSYEKEYRVVELNFQGEKPFYKDELKTIIFGLKANQKDIDAMIRLCQENDFSHVKFKKAETIHGKFELAIRDL
ncbi:DUF2971 domain-containing protein [Sulfurospirillum diekertiae]|uniref:DUF2971 domain-containing protein n=1 Tax=Sulfurospirillum diekertiae TaxID=1854492 RepID=A0A1Y0HGJ9_9BACT|nr:DUF2971 domain-containing protein [Sulfurospirillum diekertiae]ARU47221.1 hypothetical protein Sdiek1_0033 [Sulfurospirillum diekertiae]ASC92075.1 hypothetical protein Sdiek2_0032 [Sulfurospirillum diekertiae]